MSFVEYVNKVLLISINVDLTELISIPRKARSIESHNYYQ